MEARRRHDGGTSAKGSELAPQNDTDRQRRAGVGAWRGDGVEQGEATAWSMARRRGGAKWKAHGSAAADRVDAVQHADATRARRPLCTLDKTARARLIRREVSKASSREAFSRS